jgi:hypothetical protein
MDLDKKFPKIKEVILPKVIHFALGAFCLYYVIYLVQILSDFVKGILLLLILSFFRTEIPQMENHLQRTGSELITILNSLFSIVKTLIDISIELIGTSLKEPKNEEQKTT